MKINTPGEREYGVNNWQISTKIKTVKHEKVPMITRIKKKMDLKECHSSLIRTVKMKKINQNQCWGGCREKDSYPPMRQNHISGELFVNLY